MQGSFWKTVAVVGVIGIGSLAILEVQNRLPRQDGMTAGADSELESLADQVAASGDKTVNALLSDSDFDKMLAEADSQSNGSSSGTPKFDATEPPLEPTPEPVLTAAADEQFFNSQPVPAQANMPVDTAVRSEALVDGDNPFAKMDESTAVAANYEGKPNGAVSPAGFVQQESFPDDGSATPKQFRREGSAAPAAAPQESAPEVEQFPFFRDEEATATAPSPTPTIVPKAELASPNPMEFFNGSPSNGGETTGAVDGAGKDGTAQSSQDVPKTTAQFFEPDDTPLQPTPEFDANTQFDNAPAFNSSPETAPGSQESPQEIRPFPGSGTGNGNSDLQFPQPNQPVGNNDGDFFTEDRVPAPRDVNPGVPNLENRLEIEDSNPNPNLKGSVPVRQPTEQRDSSLPFAEDINSSGPSDPFRVPDLSDSGKLSIPDTNPPSRDFTRDFPMPQDTGPVENRTFPNQPNTTPSLTPTERNGARQFNGGSRPSDGTGQRFNGREMEFNNTIPQFNDNASRNFDRPSPTPDSSQGSQPGTLGTDFPPIDSMPRLPDTRQPNTRQPGTRSPGFDIGDNRRDDVRQVSGVMRPNLTLEKTAPENATVGTPLNYKIFVRNQGDATAYEVVVEDEITAGAKVDGASPQADYDRSTSKLIWTFAEIAPNESQEITVRLTPTGEGMLDGVASVKFKSRVKATTVITAPKLKLEMAGPDEVKLGEEVAYRYIITNEGSGEARDVYVRTVLPESGGLKHPSGRDLEYDIGDMVPGQQREIVLAVIAAEPGEYRAEAEVSANGGAKDQAGWRTNIVGAQLQIVRRGPKRRFVGRSAVYENIVSNETNFDAIDARVVEVVPSGMRFMGANRGGQYDQASRSVTWTINRLGAGRQEQFQIELMPTESGTRESTVTIFENAGLKSDDYVSTTVVEDLHNVGAKMSQLDGPIAVGETFGFTIGIDNRGTADATDVELTVDVPREIKVVGAGSREIPAQLVDGNQVQYSVIVRIEPNKMKKFELKLQGAEPVRNGVVKAKVRYRQMEEPLVVSESVTVYRDDL